MSHELRTHWPDLRLPHGVKTDSLIIPHVLARSAVFGTLEYAGGAIRPTVSHDNPLSLDATSQYEVEQTNGPRLSQGDADLFYWMLGRVYRDGAPPGSAQTRFKRAEALTALGRTRGGKSDFLLENSLQRLVQAHFNFRIRDCATGEMQHWTSTRLLSASQRPENNTTQYDYHVEFAEEVALLLHDNSWLTMRGAVRNRFVGDSLAKGLHAYFASNKQVFAMWPETLKRLMGRETMQNSKWLRVLGAALKKISTETGWPQCEIVQVGQHAGKVSVRKGGIRNVADAPQQIKMVS